MSIIAEVGLWVLVEPLLNFPWVKSRCLHRLQTSNFNHFVTSNVICTVSPRHFDPACTHSQPIFIRIAFFACGVSSIAGRIWFPHELNQTVAWVVCAAAVVIRMGSYAPYALMPRSGRVSRERLVQVHILDGASTRRLIFGRCFQCVKVASTCYGTRLVGRVPVFEVTCFITTLTPFGKEQLSRHPHCVSLATFSLIKSCRIAQHGEQEEGW